MFNFCLNFVTTHRPNTFHVLKIAQRTELSQPVKQCVLTTLKRDGLVCNTVSSIVYASLMSCILYVCTCCVVVFVIAA